MNTNEKLRALLTDLRDSRLMRLHGDAYMPRIEAAIASLSGIDLTPTEHCKPCDGKGYFDDADDVCENCGGFGKVPLDAVRKVIPKLHGLADVIRKYGACAPAALDAVADQLEALVRKDEIASNARATRGEGK